MLTTGVLCETIGTVYVYINLVVVVVYIIKCTSRLSVNSNNRMNNDYIIRLRVQEQTVFVVTDMYLLYFKRLMNRRYNNIISSDTTTINRINTILYASDWSSGVLSLVPTAILLYIIFFVCYYNVCSHIHHQNRKTYSNKSKNLSYDFNILKSPTRASKTSVLQMIVGFVAICK